MFTTSKCLLGSLTLVLGVLLATEANSFAADAPVSGVFKGNGKEAKLAHVTALKGEPFMDKPTIKLVFTEKDHSKEAKPHIMAGFGKFGSALIITIKEDGKIIGCEVAHAAHEKSGFSSLGDMKMNDFKLDGGKVQGMLSTDGEVKTFGQTWEVKIKFQVKVP